MERILVCYSNDKFNRSRKLCVITGKLWGGFTRVEEYTPKDIDLDFSIRNKSIFEIERGAGLWLWKPYIIYKSLLKANMGDIVFYCDAGAFFIRSAKPIFDSMDQDIWLTELPLAEEQFTKPSVFKTLHMTEDKFTKTPQRCATYIAFRKSKFSIQFIEEWLQMCQDFELLSPEEGEHDCFHNPNRFISHREDQSLLSLLSKKYNIRGRLQPITGREYPELNFFTLGSIKSKIIKTSFADNYPACLFLHKSPNPYKLSVVKKFIFILAPSAIRKLYYKRKNRQIPL